MFQFTKNCVSLQKNALVYKKCASLQKTFEKQILISHKSVLYHFKGIGIVYVYISSSRAYLFMI